MQYAASRRADKAWKGRMFGALGDRSKKGEDPPLVLLKPSYFEWRKVRLPSDREDSGAMAVFYEQPENEGDFYHLEGGKLELNDTSVPNFALVPLKIAADALEVGYTPWEVHDAMLDFEDDKGDEVKKLLEPCKNWALSAALRGDQGAETSKMVYVLTSILGSQAQLMRKNESQIEGHPENACAEKNPREGHRRSRSNA